MKKKIFQHNHLIIWMEVRGIETAQLAKWCNLSRVTIWKVKKGIAISSKSAAKIKQFTRGEVIPLEK